MLVLHIMPMTHVSKVYIASHEVEASVMRVCGSGTVL